MYFLFFNVCRLLPIFLDFFADVAEKLYSEPLPMPTFSTLVDTTFGQTQTPTVFLSSHGMFPHRCLLTQVYEPVYVFLQWGQTNLVVPPPLPLACLVTYFHKGVGSSLVFFRFSSSSSHSSSPSSYSSPWYVPLPTSLSSSSFLLWFPITIIK